jgi:glycolate oxidase subunit GlcD
VYHQRGPSGKHFRVSPRKLSRLDQLIENLRAIVGRENVLAGRDELLVYECDGLPQHRHTPRAVVFPASTEEVASVVGELSRANVSFAPRGAGTGLSGGALAVNRGVIIELARMRQLLKLDVENRLAVVQTGMVNAQVSRAVAAHGLYYAPDPSSGASCTVGGNIAENAGGIHCLKYGVTTDHVVGARVVLSGGAVVDLGAAGAGDASGYDLLGTFVGSEGTFGIATEATVKLLPLPQSVRTLLADFADIDDASRAVSAIIAAGLIPAALEMVDGATIRAVEASVFAAGLPLDAQAALLIELDGLEAGIDEEARRAEDICMRAGARGVRRAADERERKRLWAARKGAFGAMGRLAPDMMLQDAVVPRSRLPEVLAETYRISAKYELILANVFHAGDGNLHPILCFDRRNPEELRRVECANREIVETCVGAGGTLTGEHGVGLDKSKYMPLLFSADDMGAMLDVRAAFDPSGLCNPGKIIPAPRGCGEARVAASRGNGGRGAAEEDDARGEARVAHEEAANGVESGPVKASSYPAPETTLGSPRSASIDQTRAAAIDDADAPLLHRRRAISRDVKDAFRLIAETAEDESRGGALVVSPASTAEAAEVFRVAAREGVPVMPAGAGGWLGIDETPSRGRVCVSTRRLARVVEHSPADLVVTVEAGVSLSMLNDELARAGQWLPLDPPCGAGASVGGIVATNAAGAHGFAYGTARAFVLGMTVVLADGRVIKVGGRVVKNVAGYDLSKLFTGSFGTLGLITEINFKLRPRPERETTLRADSESVDAAFAAAGKILRGGFLPVALDVRADGAPREPRAERPPRFKTLARFAGSARTVESQAGRALDLFRADDALTGVEAVEDDARLWAQGGEPTHGAKHDIELKINVPPTRLPDVLRRLEETLGATAALDAWDANVAAGRARVRVDRIDSPAGCIDALARLRAELGGVGGSVVVESVTGDARDAMDRTGFDRWGLGGERAALMRRIKQKLDPRGLLPRRFFA